MQAELARSHEAMNRQRRESEAKLLQVQAEAEKSAASTYDLSTPVGTPRKTIMPSFFENMFASPTRPNMTYMPATVTMMQPPVQTQTQVDVSMGYSQTVRFTRHGQRLQEIPWCLLSLGPRVLR